MRSTPLLIFNTNDRPEITHEDCTYVDSEPLVSILRRAARLDPAYRAAYFSPIGTVLCQTPNKDFWRRVYGELGRTRRRLKQVFSRKLLEQPDAWIPGPQESETFLNQAGHRRLSFTGVLLIDNAVIPLHGWPTRDEVGYKPRRRGGRNRKRR